MYSFSEPVNESVSLPDIIEALDIYMDSESPHKGCSPARRKFFSSFLHSFRFFQIILIFRW